MILCGSNDLFVQAESNDTHYDHDIKIFGSRLGHFVPYTSHRLKKTRKSRIIVETHKGEAQQSHYIHIFLREQAVSHAKFSVENDYDDKKGLQI